MRLFTIDIIRLQICTKPFNKLANKIIDLILAFMQSGFWKIISHSMFKGQKSRIYSSWYFSSVGADKFSMKIFWDLYNTFEHPVGFKFCNFVVHTGAYSHKIFNILNFPKILFQFSPLSNGSKVCQSLRTGSSLLMLQKFSQKLENGTIFPV